MKSKMWFVVIAAVVFFSCAGCAKNESASPESSGSATPPVSGAKTVDMQTTGTVTGKVVYEGTVPPPRKISVKGNPECSVMHSGGEIVSEELVVGAAGGVKNAFIYIKEGLEGYHFDTPAEGIVIDNRQCIYVPRVSGAQTGQAVTFLNSDPTLHNVHTYSKNQASWNLGLPFQGMKVVKKFSAPEIMVTLKCDVHPWMLGYLGVLTHPCYAVTDENGVFSIKNLPPGSYTIEVWHEKLGVQSQSIEIGPQETKELGFKYASTA